MSTISPRRAIVGWLLCATVGTAVAVQPGLAAPPADKQDHGKAGAPGQAAKAAPAPAPAAAAAPAAGGGGNKGGGSGNGGAGGNGGGNGGAHNSANNGGGNGGNGGDGGNGGNAGGSAGEVKSTGGGGGSSKSSGGGAAQSSRGGGAGTPGARVTAAPASRGDRGSKRTRSSSSGSIAPAPAPSASDTGNSRSNGSNNSRSSRQGRALSEPTGSDVAQPAPEPAAPALPAAQPSAVAADTAAASRRDASSTSLRGDAPQATARQRSSFYRVSNQLLGLEGSGAPSGSLAGLLAADAANSADLGVRQRGTGSAAKPQLTPRGVESLERRSPLSRALRGVTKVIPTWVWWALGALGALVLLLGAQTILATARTRRLKRQRAKLMEDIGLLQEALLPAVPVRMGGLSTSVAYRPADGLAAGGDFYDAFALPGGRVGLLLGDVSGHGREALAKTALVRFTVRAHLEAGMSPREAISIAGRSLDGRLGDDFATVVAAIHDPQQGTLTYSSAGHPPPLVVGPPAHDPLTAASAPPIDAGFPTGHRQTVLPMPEGTSVALYSDGLIEARVDGEAIGSEHLTRWLAELGPDATAKDLVDLVVERADRVRDDLAAVVLHAAPGADAPATRVEQLKLDVLDADGPDLDAFLLAAGVDRVERRRAGRRVSEELAITGGVMVEVRVGEHPHVDVSPIGGRVHASRSRVRAH